MTSLEFERIYYTIVFIYINVLRDHWSFIIYFLSLTFITQLIITCINCVAIIISMDFIEYILFCDLYYLGYHSCLYSVFLFLYNNV